MIPYASIVRRLYGAVRATAPRPETPPEPLPFHRSDWSAELVAQPTAETTPDARAAFEAQFRETYGLQPDTTVALVGSGRTSLDLGLSVLRQARPGRRKVVLPTYCCSALIQPIADNGLTAVFIDTTEQLISTRDQYVEALGPDVLAVIVVNLCGRRLPTEDMDAIIRACRAAGAYAIEDNCQDTTRHHGSDAFDASMYSFGFAKPIRATAGGALAIRGHGEVAAAQLAGYADQPDHAPATRLRYYATRYGWPNNEIDTAEFSAARVEFGRVKMSALDITLAQESLRRLPAAQALVNSHSQEIWRAIQQNVVIRPRTAAAPPPRNTFVRWPIILPSPDIANLFWSHMNALGIELEGMYKPLHLTYEGEKIGKLAVAESIYTRIYNIPNRANLDRDALSRIISALRSFSTDRLDAR